MRIVVIGGSGQVGSNVVKRLAARAIQAVPASPATGVDTISGEGLAEVMAGADVVVDISDAPPGGRRGVRVLHHLDAQPPGRSRRRRGRRAPRRGLRRCRSAARQRVPARQGRPGGRDRGALRSLHDPALHAVPRVPAPDRGSRRRGRPGPPPHRANPVAGPPTRSPRPWPSSRPARRPTAASSWAGRRRSASTPGLGACSPPRATTARSSPTRTRATSTSCTAAGCTTGDGARIGAIDFDRWLAGEAQVAVR